MTGPATEAVLKSVADGVATLTLNRPQALNALDSTMAEALGARVVEIENDPAVRAVVLAGAGGHFMAGGDLKWFQGFLEKPAAEKRRLFEVFVREGAHRSVLALRRMPKPVIASVRGAAAGFGLSLVLASDLALASENAVFTLAYVNIGTSPDGGSTHALVRAVGMKRAMEIALLGERFDAKRALALGIVNRVVPEGELDRATAALARRLAAGPAEALGRTKALINASWDASLAEQLDAEAASFAACAAGADFAEGIRAFVEKRPAKFGRA